MAIFLPTLVAGLGWGDYRGGYFFAGILRLVFVHHATFCVNSLAHFLGSSTYDDVHSPKDHIVTALVTLGEGYHNFHHLFAQGIWFDANLNQKDYRNGIRYFDYDPTKWLISLP
jgi:stearoyl-CoA desaturase (Delta-9 desaturase)